MELVKAFAMAWGKRFYLGMAGITVFAYLCGCFNGAVLVSKYILKDDIRGHGSGNAGLTNFHRVFGGKLTAVVILTDVLKAVVAVLVSVAVMGYFAGDDPTMMTYAKYWAGLFCLLGHMFPVFFGFKGGKGILSGGTVALLIDWRVALVVWGGFLVLSFLTRYVSLGSIWAGATFPIITWLVYGDLLLLMLAVLLGGLVLWQHRGNMVRLIQGKENKFSLHKKEESK